MRRVLQSIALIGLFLVAGACERVSAQSPSLISVQLTSSLNSGTSKVGDFFTARLAEPLVVGGRIVARKDAVVIGRVSEVSAKDRSHGARITLQLKGIQSSAARYPLHSGDLTVRAGSELADDIIISGGFAKLSAALPSVKNTSPLLTDKREIALPPSTILTFYLSTVIISPKERA